MTAAELTVELKGLEERTDNLQRQVDRQDRTLDELKKTVDQVNTAVAKLQQKVDDHIAHVEKWDARRWTTIGFLVAGLITLIANLILLFVKGK